MGAEAVFTHVPQWRDPLRRLATAALALSSFALGTALQWAVDALWPAWTMAGHMAVLLIGFAWTGQFFWRRKAYRARWREQAYYRAFTRHIAPGLPLIFAAIAHTAYLPGARVVTGPAAWLITAPGWYLLITGLLVWARGGHAIGADYGLMLYVYFPEESRVVNSAIYALLRHPMYSGAVRVGMALGLLHGTLWSIAFGLFMPIGLTLWLRWVEEPELLERFGEGYAAYRKTVPAFWPRGKDFGRFWRYLIVGDLSEARP